MNMYAQPLARFLKPAYCWLWSLALTVKRSLIHSRWRFDFLVWAIDDCSSLWACFNVSFKVGGLCKAAPAIIADISFCQFSDVFLLKMRALHEFQLSWCFQLVWRVLSEMPIDFSIFLPLGFVHPYSYPFLKPFSSIQIPLHLVKFVETISWDKIWLEKASR